MAVDAGIGSHRPRSGPFAFRLLVTIGWLAVIAFAFALGYLLAGYDATQAMSRIQTLQTERDALSEALAAKRDEHARLERTHLIDREAKRAAQAQLVELQGERLRLAKQVAYLMGLMREGSAGVVEVKEFVLTEGQARGTFDYHFTLSQLVPGFGRSVGTALVKIVLRVDDEPRTLSLADLPGSTSGEHSLDFDHFQSFEGRIVLGQDADPQEVVVEIKPGNNNLLESSDAFVWRVEGGGPLSLMPADFELPADTTSPEATDRPEVKDTRD
jgi:hypothetical protein